MQHILDFPAEFLRPSTLGGLAMGRGRQKAKHTKVARELKYFSPNTDLNALEKEIGHIEPTRAGATGIDAEPEYEDKWADLYDDEGTDEDDEESDDNRR